MEEIAANLFLFRDTCHVYVLCDGENAVLIDFGDGEVLEQLPALGVRHVTDILITHHHRDQVQGLGRALEHAAANGGNVLTGVRMWAPHNEQDLFHSVDSRWQSRPLLNNYDVRQDRFSLLQSVPLFGTLKDYATYNLGDRSWTVLPAPGHTPGSIILMTTIAGQKTAFTGDLIASPGKVWSMSALQWSYHAMEGAAVMIPVLVDLQQRDPALLLPSHGEVMRDPQQAIKLLLDRLRHLLDARQENMRMAAWLSEPYLSITPHLLRNRTSVANSYVLLSESGKAMLIDFGYDFVTSNNNGPDRALHRPWLYTLPVLKRDFGVTSIDVVLPTHYHDDHVAGINLLREVEGTQVWAAENFADLLENPNSYDLPCLWYDPIPVDRVLAAGEVVQWEEYTFEVYPLPGHTRYASAIAFTVDGKRVLATGDQHKGPEGIGWNYVYQNRFEVTDYADSAELYARLAPDLILPGHWDPLWTAPGYFEYLRERGTILAQLHRDLLPVETISLGGEGFAARIRPYHFQGKAGRPIEYRVEVRNPLPEEALMIARLVLPSTWQAAESEKQVRLASGAVGEVAFAVTPPEHTIGQRFRLAVDLTAGSKRLGQQAEALVDLS
jgi:glyoxylase-like metal-dependent hydrolase (beta-lactamase superfamily II)